MVAKGRLVLHLNFNKYTSHVKQDVCVFQDFEDGRRERREGGQLVRRSVISRVYKFLRWAYRPSRPSGAGA